MNTGTFFWGCGKKVPTYQFPCIYTTPDFQMGLFVGRAYLQGAFPFGLDTVVAFLWCMNASVPKYLHNVRLSDGLICWEGLLTGAFPFGLDTVADLFWCIQECHIVKPLNITI